MMNDERAKRTERQLRGKISPLSGLARKDSDEFVDIRALAFKTVLLQTAKQVRCVCGILQEREHSSTLNTQQPQHFGGMQYGIRRSAAALGKRGREPQNIEHRMSNDEGKRADGMLSLACTQGNG